MPHYIFHRRVTELRTYKVDAQTQADAIRISDCNEGYLIDCLEEENNIVGIHFIQPPPKKIPNDR